MDDIKYKNLNDKLADIYRSQRSAIDVSVWITINGNDEEVICMYDVYANPFKLGDKIYVRVDELYPRDLERYRGHVQEGFTKSNEEKIEMFHRKKIELISEEKYVTTKLLERDKLKIEYFAKFVEK